MANPVIQGYFSDSIKRRNDISARFGPGRLNGVRPGDIRNVLVINAASRSGSSFLHRLLSFHPDMISLYGEDQVFYNLCGLSYPVSVDDSDALPKQYENSVELLENIAVNLLQDSGCLYSGAGLFPTETYLTDCCQRIFLQWPKLNLNVDSVYKSAEKALAGLPEFSPENFWLSFLRQLNAEGAGINPYYYDLSPEMIHKQFPGLVQDFGPPSAEFFEDPPFIVPQPRVFSAKNSIAEKTLLLKASSNCYRADFVKKLFPNANYKFILLARNPLASINGLMDGWLSLGFFSRNVSRAVKLNIDGYADKAKPWTQAWWKFDLPPGWAGFSDKKLEEVCAYQWASANEQILNDEQSGVFEKSIRVNYERFLKKTNLAVELDRIFDFAGLAPFSGDSVSYGEPVMAVGAPGPGKWLKRKEILLPLCSGKIAEIAGRLGYSVEEAEKWL